MKSQRPTNITTFLAKSVITRNSQRDAKYHNVCASLKKLESTVCTNICAGCGTFWAFQSDLHKCYQDTCKNKFCSYCLISGLYTIKVDSWYICKSCAVKCCNDHDGNCESTNLVKCVRCPLFTCVEHQFDKFCSKYCARAHKGVY